MTSFKPSLSLAALLCAAAMPALAASSTASSASDSASSTASSASDSLKTSSNGSSKATRVADGDYRIIEVAAVAERPGTLRLKLQAVADAGGATGAATSTNAADDDGTFYLYLPQQTAAQSRLAQGQALSARQRPYGVSFARADDGLPFFLVLADDWMRELPSRTVAL